MIPNTTAILLNWKRPDNLKLIIKKLKEQTYKPYIYLWNNNKEDKNKYEVDVQINSSENFFCWPRWIMGSLTKTKYIFTLDDDLIFKDDNIIKDCVEYISLLPEDTILGYTGIKLNNDKNYRRSKNYTSPQKQDITNLDIIKGRFMFLNKSLLNRVEITHDFNRGDDIRISSYSKNKIIPSILYKRIYNLPTYGHSLENRNGHYKTRQEVVNRYFR